MEEKLKFAVFIDFDNIEIGVKSTLHKEFDVDVVLEGIKERGEVVSKVAYGNWSRQGQATRAFTEHGVQMVQRDTTPRGDKNGADINLALDALELAFTRDHINAFAIISGDSDFMALVNKLKQYNKRVYIVGGKAFTSTVLQRNCHEFISYESLLDTQGGRSRRGAPAQRTPSRPSTPIDQAAPLLDRALRSLELRGVTPQMGLLKSTMLQLEPAFNERDFGASSFSGFIEKLVARGLLTLKTVDGQYIVERRPGEPHPPDDDKVDADEALAILNDVITGNADLLAMGIPPREIQALLKASDPDFEEKDYGFANFNGLLNLALEKGLLRTETKRDGAVLYRTGDGVAVPGTPAAPPPEADTEVDDAEGLPRRSRSRSRRRRRKRRDGPGLSANAGDDSAARAIDDEPPPPARPETKAAAPQAKAALLTAEPPASASRESDPEPAAESKPVKRTRKKSATAKTAKKTSARKKVAKKKAAKKKAATKDDSDSKS